MNVYSIQSSAEHDNGDPLHHRHIGQQYHNPHSSKDNTTPDSSCGDDDHNIIIQQPTAAICKSMGGGQILIFPDESDNTGTTATNISHTTSSPPKMATVVHLEEFMERDQQHQHQEVYQVTFGCDEENGDDMSSISSRGVSEAVLHTPKVDNKETSKIKSGAVLSPLTPPNLEVSCSKDSPLSNASIDDGSQKRVQTCKWFFVLFIFLIGVAALVGGICGSGTCNSANDTTNNTNLRAEPNDTSDPGPIPDPVVPPKPSTAAAPFVFNTTEQLYNAVDDYLLDPRSAMAVFGRIEDWQVGRLTDFSLVFSSDRQPLAAAFNANVSAWDIRNAVTLYAMFHGASSFSQNMCAWGDIVRPTANLTNVFAETFCESTQDPQFARAESGIYLLLGPWCAQTCV